jgi:hypothetical protein
MLYTSIDIGYHNMGLVQADESLNVTYAKRIDIARYSCNNADCHLHHTREVADLVAHFVKDYASVLESADVVLMERQPPGGLTNIESVLMYIFRSKIKLISPNSVHAHFGYNHLDYEQRKERVVSIASKYFRLPEVARKHDMADAFCMILYEVQKKQLKFKVDNESKGLPFDNYRYGC